MDYSIRREAIGGVDQLMQDAGFREGVAGAFDEPELRFRPGAVQVPRCHGRAGNVVAALHDDGRDRLQPSGVADELPLLQPAGVDEIMVLDARECIARNRLRCAARCAPRREAA